MAVARWGVDLSPERGCGKPGGRASYRVRRLKTLQYFRNKHEVHIVDGHVTLFCIFDPAPTGIERHRPGEYSDYEPLSQVLGTGRTKLISGRSRGTMIWWTGFLLPRQWVR